VCVAFPQDIDTGYYDITASCLSVSPAINYETAISKRATNLETICF